MVKILFVCHGNICRSPMAEFILKKMVKERRVEDNFIISSAATSDEEIGNDIHFEAKKCLKEHNIDISSHSARQINAADLLYYDYIIAMEEYNINNLTELLGPSEKYSLLLDFTNPSRDIEDPWYTGDFEKAYKDIELGCQKLIEYLCS